MARGFWRKAYILTHGMEPPADLADDSQAPTSHVLVDAPVAIPFVDGLPDHLQPGKIMTMQPVDATASREFYVNNGAYWGQPKRNGWRLVVVATRDETYYQARSLNMQSPPALEIDAALKEVADRIGPFVLDGERVYLDVLGGEHKTAPEAGQTNRANGSDVFPHATYAIFKALFASGVNLAMLSEKDRIAAGEEIGSYLIAIAPDFFEVVSTARTQMEKAALVAKQQEEKREGEVWVMYGCCYVGGKTKGVFPPIVRTKYKKKLHAVVMGLTPTTAEGRPFGAVEVGVYRDGKLFSIGRIGTGFSLLQMDDLAARYACGPLTIKVTTQGFTVNDQVCHGAFKGFSEKVPEECVWEGIESA
jgi:bifunctional non-homologous end joining protein LigD